MPRPESALLMRVREQPLRRWLAAIALAGALALGSVVGLPAGVAAQQEPQVPAMGITVTGFGLASAPAETAELQMIVGQPNYGPPTGPTPGATPGAEERGLAQAVVSSLVDAGVAQSDIEVIVSPVFSGYYGPSGGVARVDVTVQSPTADRVAELIDAATVGAANERLVLSQVGVGYGVADCAPLQREARVAALSDARARGEQQAELSGLTAGAIVGVTDVPVNPAGALSPYYGGAAPVAFACGPTVPMITTGASISVAPYDPSAEAVVNVYAQVAVTYEIVPAAGATPQA